MPQQPSEPQNSANDQDAGPKKFSFLAYSMAQDEDITILRRFDELNVLNLLVLQDEIHEISESLKELYRTEEEDPDEVPPGYLASYISNRSPRTNNGQEKEAMQARKIEWTSLRGKLREYSGSHLCFREFHILKNDEDSYLLEIAQLRNLDPPSPTDIARLRKEVTDLAAASKLTSDTCWGPDYEDDFAVIRAESRKDNRFNRWAILKLNIIKWELWGWKKEQTVRDDPRNIVYGSKRRHMSKLEMAKKHAFTSRLLMALFGGVSLIIPTILMAKLPGINYSLIITSVSVSIFALVLAFGAMDSTGKDVLGMTAAYTAVLVVFVGTSLAEGGSGAASVVQSNSTSV